MRDRSRSAVPDAVRSTAGGPPRGTRATSHALLPAVVLAGTLGLNGCTSELRVATARPDPGPHPVVTTTQARDVLARVDAAVQAGNTARRVNAYGPRVVGPSLELAEARIAMIKDAVKGKSGAAATKAARSVGDPVPGGSLTDTRLIVPSQNGWPRFFVVAGRSPESPTPVLRVLRSADARAPYGLWTELAIVPGATLSRFPPPERGTAALAADAPGLLLSPEDAVRAYADLLTKGTKSRQTRYFGSDELRGQIAERLRDDRKSLKAVAKKVTDRHVADRNSVIALRTADGGALVVGTIRQTYEITVKSGAGKITPKGDLAKLSRKTSFTKRLTRTAVEVVALSVPRTGGGVVRLVAATKGDVALKGS